MNTVRLSFIVPVYNVQDYIGECINSITSQWNDRCEIVLVDDGSTDNSGDICDRFEQERIIVIHKENGGLSSARNEGLKAASGEYIAFVDSDDRIAPNSIKEILKWIKMGGAEYCFMQGIKFYPDGTVEDLGDGVHKKPTYDKERYISYIATRKKYPGSACTKLYRKEFLTANNILFPSDRRLSEDLGFTLQCLIYASDIDVLECPYYEYRQNRKGSITTAVNEKTLEGIQVFIEEGIQRLTDNKRPKNSMCKKLMGFVAYEYVILLYNFSFYKGCERQRFLAVLKNNKWVMNFATSPKTRAINLCLRFMGIEFTSRILGIIK